MQIKTTLLFHFILVSLAIIKKPIAGKNEGRRVLLERMGDGVDSIKISTEVPQIQPCDLAMSLLGM